jgi:hypothetical protein
MVWCRSSLAARPAVRTPRRSSCPMEKADDPRNIESENIVVDGPAGRLQSDPAVIKTYLGQVV